MSLFCANVHAGSCESKSGRYQFDNSICLFTNCWNDWKQYYGEIQGYVYINKKKCHKGLCIKKKDEGEENAARFDLFTDPKEKNWRVEIHSCIWRPKGRTVITFPHSWHFPLLIGAVASFGTEFGDWKYCSNNCHAWSRGFVSFLKDSAKYDALTAQCDGPMNDGADLVSYTSTKYDCELSIRLSDSPPVKKAHPNDESLREEERPSGAHGSNEQEIKF